MTRRVQWGLGILIAAAVGLLIWAIAAQVAVTTARRRLSAMIERSHYAFVADMDQLEVQLGKLAVSSQPEEDVALLSRVIALSQSCQGCDLPADWRDFLARVGDYSGYLQRKALTEGGLSGEERANLAALRDRQTQLGAALQGMDAASLLSLDQTPPEAGAEDERYVTQEAAELPVLLYDGPFSQAASGPPKGLSGADITQEEALALAQAFVGETRVVSATATAGLAGDIPTLGVDVDTADSGLLHLQLTRQGGQILWMIPELSPGGATLTQEEGRERAAAFLRDRGFADMEESYSQLYAGLLTVHFLPTQEGILLYPDLVKVQVSLETGAIIGFEAGNYLRHHIERDLPTPTLAEEEARKRAGNLTIEGARLCLIPIDGGREAFCYEIQGSANQKRYLVYINAETGVTEKLLQLVEDEAGTLST